MSLITDMYNPDLNFSCLTIFPDFVDQIEYSKLVLWLMHLF